MIYMNALRNTKIIYQLQYPTYSTSTLHTVHIRRSNASWWKARDFFSTKITLLPKHPRSLQLALPEKSPHSPPSHRRIGRKVPNLARTERVPKYSANSRRETRWTWPHISNKIFFTEFMIDLINLIIEFLIKSIWVEIWWFDSIWWFCWFGDADFEWRFCYGISFTTARQ